MPSDNLLAVRATVSLPGLPAGAEATVRPAQPYIAALLKAGFLVPAKEKPSA
jgi:hypothetical protein